MTNSALSVSTFGTFISGGAMALALLYLFPLRFNYIPFIALSLAVIGLSTVIVAGMIS